MVDLELTIIDKPDATELRGPIESIQFEDVHFTYPNTEAQY